MITVTYDDTTTTDLIYAGNEGLFKFSLGGSVKDINSYELLQSDAGNLTVVYSGKTCTYPITVAEKQLQSIEVKNNTPNKTTYFDGGAFDVTGLVINATYDNGKTVEVPYAGNETDFSLVLDNGTILTTTDNSVIVTYGTKNATFSISVNPIVISRIAVKAGTPNKRTFIEGQKLDVTGLVIIATKNNETSEEITYAGNESSFTFAPATSSTLTLSTKQVEVTYFDGTNSFKAPYELTVNKKQVTGISVDSSSMKTVYFTDETLDVTNLLVTVNYDNGTSENIEYEGNGNKFSFNPSLTTLLTTGHTGDVTVTYEGKRGTYAISITEPDPTIDRVLKSIAIKKLPTKIVYDEGEELDPTVLLLKLCIV